METIKLMFSALAAIMVIALLARQYHDHTVNKANMLVQKFLKDQNR